MVNRSMRKLCASILASAVGGVRLFFLIGQFLSVSAGFAQSDAKPAPQKGQQSIPTDFELFKECNSAPSDKELAIGGQALEHFNPKCNHERMLREGNNVYAVYFLQSQQKLDIVLSEVSKTKDAGGSLGNLLTRFAKDGTCLQVDVNEGGAAGMDHCLERLKRQALDAKIQTRESTLKHNKARFELINDVGGVHEAASVDNLAAPKNTIAKDLRRISDRKNKSQQAMLQQLLGARDVTFGTPGDSIINNQKLSLERAKNVNLEDKNKDAAARFQTKEIDVGISGTKDAALEKAIEEAKTKSQLGVKFAKDQKDIAAEKKASGNNMKLDYQSSVSLDAFDETMTHLQNSARDKEGRNGTLESINSVDLDVTITAPDPRSPAALANPTKPPPVPVDQAIIDSIESIRKDF